jgi:hypothetical protein
MAVIGGGIAFGSVAAEEGDNNVTLEEVGITDRVRKLYHRGRIEEAENLLDQHDVQYSSNSTSEVEVVDDELTEDNATISPNTLGGKRPKDESDFSLSVVSAGHDDWLVTGVAELKGNVGWAKTSRFINDACAITYDSNEWSSKDATQENVWLSSIGDGRKENSIRFNQYPADKGPSAIVENIDTFSQDYSDHTVTIQTKLTQINTGNDDIPVYFNYEHNWANSKFASINVITYNLPFISVDSGTSAATAWSAKLSAETGETDNK